MEKFFKIGFTEIDGKKEQISIGDIKVFDDHIEVETLGGCSKVALENAMHKIANEKKKTVKAKFNDEEVVIEPEE